MAEAFEVQIAEAVVAELNGTGPSGGWLKAFTAEFDWLAVYQDDDERLETLRVDVVPDTIANESLDRARSRFDYGVEIVIQKRISFQDRAAARDEMKALAKFAEQIHDYYLDNHELASLTGYRVLKADREQVHDLDALYAQHVWGTVITLGVRGYR